LVQHWRVGTLAGTRRRPAWQGCASRPALQHCDDHKTCLGIRVL
jgi:hypothetical protein